jgi:hypothetical protein
MKEGESPMLRIKYLGILTVLIPSVFTCAVFAQNVQINPIDTPVQLKLRKVARTKEAQPFAEELGVDASGHLVPLAHSLAPDQGCVFWLLEVEFGNRGDADVEIKGAKMGVKAMDGGRAILWSFLGTAYIPYSTQSFKLRAKKKQTEKFLVEVTEGAQQIDFTYEGLESLLILSR